MPNIILIRMEKTVWEEEGRISGNLEVPLVKLTPFEIQQLSKKVKSLHLDTLYCSSTRGARETAVVIEAELGLTAQVVDNLTEFHFGLWQGMLESEIGIKHYRTYQVWSRTPSKVCPSFGGNIGRLSKEDYYRNSIDFTKI